MSGVRRGLGVLVAVLAAVATLGVLPTAASAMVPPAMGTWPGLESVNAKPLAPPVRHPLPARSGSGRRVVYSEHTMHVWAVNAHGSVVRDWSVSGRPDWPNAGTYHVFSKSRSSRSTISDVGFQYMIRFAHGHTTNIGFHSIPYDSSGHLIQTVKQLGHPVKGGGCIRSQLKDAEWLYGWSPIGTTVVVVR
jgi:lipoprotein-anchoring transpeptidase ErfK/SrfK